MAKKRAQKYTKALTLKEGVQFDDLISMSLKAQSEKKDSNSKAKRAKGKK